MDELAQITEPKPVTALVLGGEPRLVSTTCQILDRAFAERIDFVVANPEPELYGDIVERFGSTAVPITFATMCQGFKDTFQCVADSKQVLVPQLGGGTVALAR